MQRLTRRDWLLIAVCLALAAVSIFAVVRYFDSAFPEASIEFKYDRQKSRELAQKLLHDQKLDVRGHKRAAVFESDGTARIFLERTLGLERANVVMRDQIRPWYWRHRWFQPEVEEEFRVDVAPSGEITGFAHRIPEDRALPDGNIETATAFLRAARVNLDDLQLVSQSERKLPNRVQRIFTWESKTIRPAGTPYRHEVTIDGNVVSRYEQRLKVPDAWLRSYRELRSKNIAAGRVDTIFMALTMIAALVIFIGRLRRGDVHVRFVVLLGLVSVVLVAGVALNQLPSSLAYYDTTSSYSAFLAQEAVFAVMQSLGTAMLLIVICGSGEVLYRERLPNQLSIPRLWTRKALASKRVFLSLIMGYALVPMFMAYQAVFYLTARRFGAWAPAEVPYDDMLNSALPWVAVLFAGFFPAFSEEFLSRAFSIPWLQKIVRSRVFAIVLAGFIWGFGHSTYPNQPFWIRGVEVGLVGVVAGFLMDRYGLLPLLIWHYTIDAIYTAALLFRSGNTYYIASAGLASLLFAIPLIVSIAGYVRRRGFVPDDDLTNATIPVAPVEAPPETAPEVAFPPPIPPTRRRLVLCIVAVAVAAGLLALAPPSLKDAVDYRITPVWAKELALLHLGAMQQRPGAHIVATPVEGFRSWNAQSSREEGGSAGDFDEIAATYLVHHGMSVRELIEVFRTRIEAGTYMVRSFTPERKEEHFVEVDPRRSRVVGYHKYQEEAHPGARLEQPAAQAIALSVFPRYGVDPAAFAVKEALSFPQPNRRDWLFHFEERTPLAASAFRRVTVRVAGAEVTQFHKHIKIPESVYREASQQTLINVVLFGLQLVGMIALLGLTIAGLVMLTRHGLPWRRAARWTALLSLVPIVNWFARGDVHFFGYSTSIAWETFRIGLITDFVIAVGMQCGLIFLALAGAEACRPYAPALLSREGRARFGRSAALAAITAIALLVAARIVQQLFAHAMPALARIGRIDAPAEVATWFPALTDTLQALAGAIIVAGAVALYRESLRARVAAVTIIAIFCASLDPGITVRELPMMLASAAATAALAWLLARYVLGGNPLAWPLTIFVAAVLSTASVLLRNERADLLMNGWAMVAVVVGTLVWVAAPKHDGTNGTDATYGTTPL